MIKSYCMFRECPDAPIFTSEYDFEKGVIDCVPESKFKVQLPDYYYKEFVREPDFGMTFDKSLYIEALSVTGGLFATNFYDVGITVLTSEATYLFLFENSSATLKGVNPSSFNVFNYNKTAIGVYKTVMYQMDFQQNFCFLYVDDDGKFLHNKGEIETGFSAINPIDKSNALSGCVNAWRSGYDGVIVDESNSKKEFKVTGFTIELKV